jgi:hypothetical protein
MSILLAVQIRVPNISYCSSPQNVTGNPSYAQGERTGLPVTAAAWLLPFSPSGLTGNTSLVLFASQTNTKPPPLGTSGKTPKQQTGLKIEY